MKKTIITVVGKDTVGIIGKVCTYLANNNINIEDISQTIVQEFFNMMMIVEDVYKRQVGTDEHGEYLCRVMRDLGVLTDGLIQTEKCSTRITFVYLNEEHERFFSSYRSPRAEIVFSPADIRYDLLDSAKILHIPSSILYDEPAKDAVEAAVTYARGKGKLISYDPNWNKVLGYNSCLLYTSSKR